MALQQNSKVAPRRNSDETIDISRKSANHRLSQGGTEKANNSDEYDKGNQRFPIKDHSLNPPKNLFSENSHGSSQVLIHKGRVIGIEVDPEIVAEINKARDETNNICQCCNEREFEISDLLLEDPSVQGTFLFMVLITESLIRIPALGWLMAQLHAKSLHDFIYSQWLLSLLFIVVFYIIVIWAVVFSDLGRQQPCDSILIMVKSLVQAQVCTTITALFERWMLEWKISDKGLEEPGLLVNLYEVRNIESEKQRRFTYPIIVIVYLFDLSIVYVLEGIYFKVFKGDVKKDYMLWIAIGTLLSLCLIQVTLLETLPHDIHGTYKDWNFYGPIEWDIMQFIFPAIIAIIWVLWRLYNLRVILEGKRFKLNEGEYTMVALTFAI